MQGRSSTKIVTGEGGGQSLKKCRPTGLADEERLGFEHLRSQDLRGFFLEGCNFYIKNKLKSETFNGKKGL